MKKKFHNGLKIYDNESLYMPIVPALSEESAIPMIAEKMLLTIFLKNSNHVVEVMVVLRLLLLILKVMQSGVHHTCGGSDPCMCTPFLLGVESLIMFLKGWDLSKYLEGIY